MATSPDPIEPKVDDRFWFEWSATRVTGAPATYDTAATALQNLAVWAWGIYTAATAIGFTLGAKSLSLGTTLIIASGSVLLFFTYWAATWVLTPPLVAFDPRIPDDIRNAYITMIETKRRRLQRAKLISLFAAVMVAWGLFAASMPIAPKPVAGVLSASIAREKDGSFLLVSVAGIQLNKIVTQPGGVRLKITADAGATPIPPANGIDVAKGDVLLPNRDGLLSVSFPVAGSGNYHLTVEWTDVDGQRIQLSRTVKFPPGESAPTKLVSPPPAG
jgi:hypothetical protein